VQNNGFDKKKACTGFLVQAFLFVYLPDPAYSIPFTIRNPKSESV